MSRYLLRIGLLVAMTAELVHPESSSKLTGRVIDPSGRVVPGADVRVRNLATGVESFAITNSQGIYEIAALAVGIYRMQVNATGFRIHVLEELTTEIGRTVLQDVQLTVGEVSQEVTVKSQPVLIDSTTTSVGSLIDGVTVQETPLNGRYFLDLAVLAPGSVTPSQNGFSTTPSRGLGALAINTAGNREETVNYVINGITLNDLVFSSILFQPSISSIQEFRIDNSTFSAEYGQSSGAVVNMATRSGGSDFHGELFEILRNDALDARNFFRFTSSHPPPFKRNQFGANVGGPLVKRKTFFFANYEGLRQAQEVDLNSLVLSDAQRSSITNSTIAKLAELIPRPNFTDSAGTPRFIGSAPAPVHNDQWGMDISHIFSRSDRLHGYYSFDRAQTQEPNIRGNTVPGFGHVFLVNRQFFSLNEIHTLDPNWINEVRLGLNRQSGRNTPAAEYNPMKFGIRDGITEPIGLPQINVAGGALNFGGPSLFPSGRADTTMVAADTMSCLCGRSSLKIGGEFRQFFTNAFRTGSGAFNFPSLAAFLADNANSFNVTLGDQSSGIAQGAFGLFLQSNYRWRPNLMLELGVRYDWNLSPEERYDRFIVFDSRTGSLVRVGPGDQIYHQNNTNFQPRLGFAWDPFEDGKTSIRGAYALLTDQPMTSIVTPTAANPPFAIPLTFSGTVRLEDAIDLAQALGLAPASIDRGFNNAYLQSWNFNVQRALSNDLAIMTGYFGSKGTHLITRRNLNQPVAGGRPYPFVSTSSTILPGVPLGNITQVESVGNSSYNALWVSAAKSLSRGFQLEAYYTWSKSLDYNSLSSQGVVLQDSYNLDGDRGPSDFDARHRLVVRAIYQLPFHGNRLTEGWQIATVVQVQSGNPINIVTTNSTLTGVANTVRPNVSGPVSILGHVDRWFDTSAFAPGPSFGNLGRNVIVGPGFNNTDFSIVKETKLSERMHLQLRAEIFDLFNHANLGQPGNVVGTPGFGRVTSTRFPTGESGSSRQMQFSMKLSL